MTAVQSLSFAQRKSEQNKIAIAKAGYHRGDGILPFANFNSVWYTRLSSTNRNLYIKENIDENVFMFTLFKCRKSDKGRN